MIGIESGVPARVLACTHRLRNGISDLVMGERMRIPAILGAVALLAGCASTQLKYNTLDVASSVPEIYTKQVLSNLSRFIDEPQAIPSQVDLQAGTIQTSNSVTPSISTPLSRSVTRNGSNIITGFTTAGVTLSANASDTWQQNWNVAPVNDAVVLRKMRTLYRHVIYRDRITEAKISNLPSGWLYWSGVDAYGRANPPPSDAVVVDLGLFGNHELYMRRDDLNAGYLSNLTLMMLPSGTTAPKGKGVTPGRAPSFLFVPQQIQPTPNQ